MSTPSEILRAARDKIADPARWTQNAHALDRYGEVVDAKDERAVRWCAMGALLPELDGKPMSIKDAVYRHLESALGSTDYVTNVNDRGGHAAVLNLYDRAIAIADLESEP